MQPQWMSAPANPATPAPVGWSQSVSGGDILIRAQVDGGSLYVVMILRNASGKLERQPITVSAAALIGITLDPATISGGSGLIQLSV